MSAGHSSRLQQSHRGARSVRDGKRAPASGHRRPKESIEGGSKISGDGLGGPAFDLVAVNEVHDLSVSKECHRRAAGLVLAEVLAGPGDSIEILAGEDGDYLLW